MAKLLTTSYAGSERACAFCLTWLIRLASMDGYQHRRIANGFDRMGFAGLKIEHVSSEQLLRCTSGREPNAAFQAMDSDVAWCFVFCDQLAGGQYQSNYLHRVGFEQRARFSTAELGSKRLNMDNFSGIGVVHGHFVFFVREEH